MSMLTQSRVVHRDAIARILDEWEEGEKAGTYGHLNKEEKRVIKALNKAREAIARAMEG